MPGGIRPTYAHLMPADEEVARVVLDAALALVRTPCGQRDRRRRSDAKIRLVTTVSAHATADDA